MGEEFKDFEVEAPVLTLEPDLTEEKEEIAKKEPEKPQEPAVEEPVLSPQEQKNWHIWKSCPPLSIS